MSEHKSIKMGKASLEYEPMDAANPPDPRFELRSIHLPDLFRNLAIILDRPDIRERLTWILNGETVEKHLLDICRDVLSLGVAMGIDVRTREVTR